MYNIPELTIGLTIGTVALIPIIVAIIEAFKRAGLPASWAPWANAVLTVIGYIVVMLLEKYPVYEPTAIMVLTMLGVFLAAGGFYEVVSRTAAIVKK